MSDILLVDCSIQARCLCCDKEARVALRTHNDTAPYLWYCLACWRAIDEAYTEAMRRADKFGT